MKRLLPCLLVVAIVFLQACAPSDPPISDLFNFEAGSLQVEGIDVDPTTAPTHNITGTEHLFPNGDGTLYLGDDGLFHTIPSGNGTSSANFTIPLNEPGAADNFLTSYDNVTGTFGKAQPVIGNVSGLTSALAAKQDTLVSGTNIKTINGSSVLGAGDLVVSAGDHSHTADNITGGSANQTILSVNGRGSWTTLLIEHISGLVAALAGKLAATAAAIVSALGYQPADNVTAVAHYNNTSNPHSVTANQVLPSQTGNSGKYLSTNGTNTSWQAPFPVGSIYIGTSPINPATLLGYGTWSAFGEGRVLIGRSSSDARFATGNTTGGTDNFTISAGNVPQLSVSITDPSHAHIEKYNSSTSGALSGWTTIDASSSSPTNVSTTTANSTTGVTATANTGSANTAISNLQPYIVAYFWVRTN